MNTAKPSRVVPPPAFRPVAGVAGLAAYEPPKVKPRVDLRLDSNEGIAPPEELLRAAADGGSELLRRYPHTQALEALIAKQLGISPREVVVTAGGDDALNRACQVSLCPGREIVLPIPTFEMLERYPRTLGARIAAVPWPSGPFPTEQVVAAVGPDTTAIALVSPNNPTGASASREDLNALAAAASQALLIVDLAYVEFADVDLTTAALALPNAIAVRSLSKAWGLAGLRVGYAIGRAELIDLLRAVGSPYPTSGLSLALAARRLETGQADMRGYVARVRQERAELITLLTERGAAPLPSQANFVLARFGDAVRMHEFLLSAGISVRRFPGRAGMEESLRITVPGDAADFARLGDALADAANRLPGAFAASARKETIR